MKTIFTLIYAEAMLLAYDIRKFMFKLFLAAKYFVGKVFAHAVIVLILFVIYRVYQGFSQL